MVVIVPRANLSIIKDREEMKIPAFYILFGENEAMDSEVYIGETYRKNKACKRGSTGFSECPELCLKY